MAPPATFPVDQCILGKRTRPRHLGVARIWEFLRGIAVWGCWSILRNDAVSEGELWSVARIRTYLWDSLLEYGRIEWRKTLIKYKKEKKPRESSEYP